MRVTMILTQVLMLTTKQSYSLTHLPRTLSKIPMSLLIFFFKICLLLFYVYGLFPACILVYYMCTAEGALELEL